MLLSAPTMQCAKFVAGRKGFSYIDSGVCLAKSRALDTTIAGGQPPGDRTVVVRPVALQTKPRVILFSGVKTTEFAVGELGPKLLVKCVRSRCQWACMCECKDD